MLFAAHERLGADLAASFMIGDEATDAEAAAAAGCCGSVVIASVPPPALPERTRVATHFDEAVALVLSEWGPASA
jgi:phosphoglycolate phosphatase-like HAD superfamily hydrolase